MSNSKLETALESWARVSTWYTSHALDEGRFHRALQVAFAELGTAISKDEFESAIEAVARRSGNPFPPDEPDKWAQRAEHVASYLNEVGGS